MHVCACATATHVTEAGQQQTLAGKSGVCVFLEPRIIYIPEQKAETIGNMYNTSDSGKGDISM